MSQFDGCRQTRTETKRLEKFLVVARQLREKGLKSLTTDSNKIWQKCTNGWSDGIQFNLVGQNWNIENIWGKVFLFPALSVKVCGITYNSNHIPRITFSVCPSIGPLLSIIVHCYPLLFIVVHYCPLLSIVVHLRLDLPWSTLPGTVTYYRWLAQMLLYIFRLKCSKAISGRLRVWGANLCEQCLLLVPLLTAPLCSANNLFSVCVV